MKKLLARLLAMAMLLQTASPVAVVQATNPAETQEESVVAISDSWDDIASLSLADQLALSHIMPISGNSVILGTASNPYLLSNASQLEELAEYVNDGNTYFNKANYKMTQNISLSHVDSWTPIGAGLTTVGSSPFSGTFDGNGKVISGLTITTGNDSQGFFGYADEATIKNLGIEDCSISGNSSVGGLAGLSVDSTISNCYVTGSVSGKSSVGGLVGASASDITNCYATAVVKGTSDYVGGLIGTVKEGSETSFCYATGAVTGGEYVGGLVGSDNGTTKNSVALNPSLTGVTANRVTGGGSGSLSGNYAWSGMTVNGTTVENGTAENEKGADLTYSFESELSKQFSEIFGTSNSAWVYTTDGLPTLSGMDGKQSSELPYYIINSYSEDTLVTISTVEDLQALATSVNGGDSKSGITYILMNDLDLGDIWDLAPIGTQETPFKGTFDGNGHVIRDMNFWDNTSDYQGLFGYIDGATIKNLGIENCTVTGKDYIGGLVGYATSSTIKSCYVIGSVSGSDYVGGLVGSAKGAIYACFATGTVSGSDYVGGLAGKLDFPTNKIQNSVALNQSVTGETNSSNVNRVVGNSEEESALENNYAWADMTVNGSVVSGTSEVTGQSAYGANLTYNSDTLGKQFSEIFSDTTAWAFEENKLPTLKSGSSSQSSELPSYMKNSEETYYISSVAELQALANEVKFNNSTAGNTYILTTDLDLSGIAWEPIGISTIDLSGSFSGIFDGGGHVIRNMTCTGNDGHQGLFGYTKNAIIQNLGIERGEHNHPKFLGTQPLYYRRYESCSGDEYWLHPHKQLRMEWHACE